MDEEVKKDSEQSLRCQPASAPTMEDMQVMEETREGDIRRLVEDSGMNSVFKKECEKSGINWNEFPFDFAEGTNFNPATVIEAILWVLNKNKDKYPSRLQEGLEKLNEIQETLIDHERRIATCSIRR